MTKIQNDKPVWVIGYWNLGFHWYLVPGKISDYLNIGCGTLTGNR